MADVSGRGPAARRAGGDGRDRAQLFLLGALALATLFVALALFLNGVIYAGTLATDDAGADADGALAYRSAADGVVRSVNAEYHGDYSALEVDLERTVRNWSAGAGRHYAARGVAANASLVGYDRGTRVAQDDPSRTFRDANGSSDWRLVSDAPGIRSYALTVNRSSLDGADGSPFTVAVENGTAAWNVSVARTADGVSVAVTRANATDPGTCDAALSEGGVATVDLTGGTLAGRQCAPLAALNWSGDATVAYRNAASATGTYSFAFNESVGAATDGTVDESHYGDGSAGDVPRYAPAVYAADLRLGYRSPSLAYEATVRVAPGEPDA